jgi:hypothetical protein
MLSMSDISTITKEILLGLPPSMDSVEADAMRVKLEADIAQMRADGLVVELPYDFD